MDRSSMLAAVGVSCSMLLAGCPSPGEGKCVESDAALSCSGVYDEAEVRAVLSAQSAAWNAGDIEGFLAGYEASPALIFTSGAKVRRGFEETKEKFEARYGADTSTMGKLGFEILDVRPVGRCKEAAIVLGRWSVEGGDSPGSGVFSVLLEKQDDGWKVVHDHTSADPAVDPAIDSAG